MRESFLHNVDALEQFQRKLTEAQQAELDKKGSSDKKFCEQKIELHKGVLVRMLHAKAFQAPPPAQVRKCARLRELDRDLQALGVVPAPATIPGKRPWRLNQFIQQIGGYHRQRWAG